MRVEHEGEYAAVASLGGAPKNPVWFYNVKKNPRVELQDGPLIGDFEAREVFGERRPSGGSGPGGLAGLCQLPAENRARNPVFVLTPIR